MRQILLLVGLLCGSAQAALHDIVPKGATDRSVTVSIIDSADGTPETGVVFNTSGIDLWYRREGAAAVDVTEATLAALTTAHTDGGFLHIADGVYRLDLPDAAFATGANYVDFGGTVTDMIVIGGRVRLTDFTLETATQNVNVTTIEGTDATDQLDAHAAAGLSEAELQAALGIHETTIATLASQTSFTLTAGSTDDDAYNGFGAFVVDASTSTQIALGVVSDYTGSTKTVQLDADPAVFTMAAGDTVILLPAKLTDEVVVDGTSLLADLGLASGNLDTQLTAIDDAVDTEVATLVSVQDTIDTNLDSLISTVGTPDGTSVSADIAAIESQTDDIGVAGAGLTAADDAVITALAALDTLIDAIKAKTDSLTFTNAGEVDSNVKSMNDAAVCGDGNATAWTGDCN